MAAATAAFTSAAVESGTVARLLARGRVKTGAMRDDDAVILRPPMAFWMVCMTAYASSQFTLLSTPDKNIDELVDLLLLDDQRRRQRNGVAGGPNQEPALERLDEARMGALAGLARDRIELDGADQPDIADVDDMRQALQRMDRVLPIGRELRGARQQPLLLIGLERGDRRRAGHRVAGIGVAVEQVDDLLRHRP